MPSPSRAPPTEPEDHENDTRRASQERRRQGSASSQRPNVLSPKEPGRVSKKSNTKRSPSPPLILETICPAASKTTIHLDLDPQDPLRKAATVWIDSFRPSIGVGTIGQLQSLHFIQRMPPITKHTLGELEASCILNNPKLRHDINFDRELHFRPNLDGPRGQAKMAEAEKYWIAVQAEFELFMYVATDPEGAIHRETPGFYEVLKKYQHRIPEMLIAAKAIILSMNEKSEIPGVREALDVDLIMQQLHRATFDLAGLSQFLERLLKAHCAPMRDTWVEKVCGRLYNGAITNDCGVVVGGFRDLFGLLEAMKLDIANHQIRHLRPVLLDSTVSFEHNYFKNRVGNSIKLAPIMEWYKASKQYTIPATDSQVMSPRDVKFQQFLNYFLTCLVEPRSLEELKRGKKPDPSLPETFKLDHERAIELRHNIHAIIYSSICTQALSMIMQMTRPTLVNRQNATKYITKTLPILLGRAPTNEKWIGAAGNIAVEIIRAATHDITEDGSAIIADSGKFIANFNPTTMTATIEVHLQRAFDQKSTQFLKGLRTHLPQVIEKTTELVSQHKDKTATELADTFVPRNSAALALEARKQKKIDAMLLAPTEAALTPVDEVARRAAHISILHWRVWADMVYLKNDASEDVIMTEEEEL